MASVIASLTTHRALHHSKIQFATCKCAAFNLQAVKHTTIGDTFNILNNDNKCLFATWCACVPKTIDHFPFKRTNGWSIKWAFNRRTKRFNLRLHSTLFTTFQNIFSLLPYSDIKGHTTEHRTDLSDQTCFSKFQPFNGYCFSNNFHQLLSVPKTEPPKTICWFFDLNLYNYFERNLFISNN